MDLVGKNNLICQWKNIIIEFKYLQELCTNFPLPPPPPSQNFVCLFSKNPVAIPEINSHLIILTYTEGSNIPYVRLQARHPVTMAACDICHLHEPTI